MKGSELREDTSAGGKSGPAAAEDEYDERSPFRPAKKDPLLTRMIPVSGQVRRYRMPSARRDLVAGVTVAALAMPSAMAFAEVAGLPPVTGLYALLLPTVAYALLGSSRQLVIGPEGSIATLIAAAVLPLAAAGSAEAAELAAMLALLVAVCFAIAWLLRLGWIADYFSRPVLLGYIHGVAVVLVIGQLGKIFGLSIEATDPLPQLGEVLRELDSASGLSVAIAAASLAVLFVLRRFMPGLPAALVVVLASILLSWALDLQAHGVAVLGPVPAGLPSLTMPTVAWQDVVSLAPAAVGIFLVCFADAILLARSFAGKHNQQVRASQELLALGAANAAAGFSQGFSVGASGSRTAVNDDMGARSQVAALFAAATVAVILLFLTEPIQYLPKPVLGAVIVFAAIGLVDLVAWRALAAVDHVEVAIAGVTMGCVIVFGVLEALVVAVGLTVIDAVRRGARPHDAVLGWVERLGRYADVSRVSVGANDAGRRCVPARRPPLLRQRAVLQGPRARGRPRRRRLGVLARLRRGGDDARRLDRARRARTADRGPPARRDHARRCAAEGSDAGAVRRGRPHREDRA